MSLVERALKKLQQAGSPIPAAHPVGSHSAPPAREVASVAASEPVAKPHAIVPERPSKIVKIDREALRGMQLLPPPALERRIAAQYRQIKRPLIDAALGRAETAIENAQVIMLASALPGEGKTFTSINLALSMAREKDVEVILVNGDVAKPHLDALFSLEGERGLLDLLTDPSAHPDSAVFKTDVPGLSLLPAGHKAENATELLASERMQQVIAQLISQDRRRILLVDSPPLLLSTESQALVASVGQIVLIVRAEMTPRDAVLDAIEATGGSKPISLILNQSSAASGPGYYEYGTYGDAAPSQPQ